VLLGAYGDGSVGAYWKSSLALCARSAAPSLDRSPRPLLRRYRLDNGPPTAAGSWSRMRCHSLLYERPHAGTVEHLRSLNYEVPDRAAGAMKKPMRVGKVGSAREEQTDPTRVECDREDQVGWSLRRAERDGQRIVVVVDELDRPRQKPSDLGACLASHLRAVLSNEALDLLLRRPPAIRTPRSLACRDWGR
jgi:hypothetical protein